MPTYEYLCEKCGHMFETHQSMAAKPLTTCPKTHCKKRVWGKGKVRRQIGSGAGLIFKGSGFYTTDYRSESYQQAAKKEADSAKPAKEAAAGSADAKSAGAKKEAKPVKAAPAKKET